MYVICYLLLSYKEDNEEKEDNNNVIYRITCITKCFYDENNKPRGKADFDIEEYFDMCSHVLRMLQVSDNWRLIPRNITIPNSYKYSEEYVNNVARSFHNQYVKSIQKEITYIEEIIDIGDTFANIKRQKLKY